jgi:hypothetical protein
MVLLAKISALQGRLSLSEWMKHNGIMHFYQLKNVENFVHSNGHLITSGALWDSEIAETTEKKFKLHVCGKETSPTIPTQTHSKYKMPQKG